jgi:hypothetical protein
MADTEEERSLVVETLVRVVLRLSTARKLNCDRKQHWFPSTPLLEAGAARLSWDLRLRCDELDITRHCRRSLRPILPEFRASSGIWADHTSTVWVRRPISMVGHLRKVLIDSSNGNPQGVVTLGTRLVSLQPYDITINLHLLEHHQTSPRKLHARAVPPLSIIQ